MNLKLIPLCLVLFSFKFSNAQQLNVKGTIVNKSQTSIEFVTVVLEQKTESGYVAYKGMSSNEKGEYLFTDLSKNSYQLTVSIIGYKTLKKQFDLTENIQFNFVLEEDVEALDGVTIIAKKPTVKHQSDRLTFNVEKTALVEGSVLETLKSTPGVLVINNAIAVKNTTPAVYINDKRVHLSQEEVFQLFESTPAASIKSVEVITKPSSKYDADNGVVLNIVMSKNLITGYRGRVYGNYTQGVFPKYNAGVSNFYKNEKINIYANYSYTQKIVNRENEDVVNFLDNNGRVNSIWKTDLDRNTRSKSHNLNVNFDYFISEHTSLSFSSNVLFLPNFNYLTKGLTTVFDAGNNRDNYFNSNNESIDKKNNLGFDLDFTQEFKNKSTLTANVHYTNYDYNRGQQVNSDYFNNDNIQTRSTGFRTDSDQKTTITTAKLDYVLPINDYAELSTGIKYSESSTASKIDLFTQDPALSTEMLDSNNSDAYNYEEGVFAAYFSYDFNKELWSFTAGLRIENTAIEGVSVKTNITNTQNYLDWFPNVSIGYQASERLNVYSSLQSTIKRPVYQTINPFSYFLNDFTLVKGNPNLKPEYANLITVGTSLSDTYIFEVYYQKSKGNIYEIPLQNNTDNTVVYSPINLKGESSYGVEFLINKYMNQRWFLYFLASYSNTTNELQGTKASRGSGFFQFNNNFSLLKDYSLNLNINLVYQSKVIQGFTESNDILASQISLKKSIFKNKGALSLIVSDIFNKQDVTAKLNNLPNQNNTRFINLDNRYIKLGFSYKFGNTNLTTNEKNKTHAERNRLDK